MDNISVSKRLFTVLESNSCGPLAKTFSTAVDSRKVTKPNPLQ